MAVQNPKKIIQISATLAGSTNEVVLIQNNSSRTLLTVNIPNQLYLRHLKGWANISSLPEAIYPINEPRDTSSARQQKQAYFRASPKIGISLRIRPIGEAYSRGIGECCILDFYGVRPGFLYNVLEYIGEIGIQPNWALTARQIDRGFGVMTSEDYISFTGYATEESEFLQDHNLVVIP
jgi:hypothetical protein